MGFRKIFCILLFSLGIVQSNHSDMEADMSSELQEGRPPIKRGDCPSCPRCGSKTIRDGHCKGRQTYKCKSPICRYRMIPKEFHLKDGKPALLSKDPVTRAQEMGFCSVCGEPRLAKGLCQRHYRQMRRLKGVDATPAKQEKNGQK